MRRAKRGVVIGPGARQPILCVDARLRGSKRTETSLWCRQMSMRISPSWMTTGNAKGFQERMRPCSWCVSLRHGSFKPSLARRAVSESSGPDMLKSRASLDKSDPHLPVTHACFPYLLYSFILNKIQHFCVQVCRVDPSARAHAYACF